MCNARYLLLLLALFSGMYQASGQSRAEWQEQLRDNLEDTARCRIYSAIAQTYLPNYPDSATLWTDKCGEVVADQSRWPEAYATALKDVMYAYRDQNYYEKSISIADALIQNYNKYDIPSIYFNAYNSKAFSLAVLYEIPEARQLLNEWEMLLDNHYTEDDDPIQYTHYATLYVDYAISYSVDGDHATALKYSLMADSVSEYGSDPSDKEYITYILATIYCELIDPQKSNMYFNELLQRDSTSVDLSIVYSTMARNFIELLAYDSAKHYLDLSQEIAIANNDSGNMDYNHKIWGDLAFQQSAYEEAAKYYSLVVTYNYKLGDEYQYNAAKLDYIRAMIHLNNELNYQSARMDTILKYAIDNEVNILVLDSYLMKLEIYERLGDYKKALEYHRLYAESNEEWMEINFNEERAAQESKYQTDLHKREAEKQTQIATLEAEQNQKTTRQRNILIGASILMLLLLVALTWIYRRLRKTNAQLQVQKATIEQRDAEKTTLMKELHHRVKNNLQIVSSLLNLQADSVKDNAAQSAFKNGQNRVEAMAMIHRYLYNSEELTTLEVDSYLKRLVQSIAYSYGYDGKRVNITYDVTAKPIDVDVAIPLGLIANELVSNAFKHAFEGAERPELNVALALENDLVFTLNDNGKGYDATNVDPESSSFGMQLVQSLVKQLKAEMKISRHHGTRVQIVVPASVVHKTLLMKDEDRTA